MKEKLKIFVSCTVVAVLIILSISGLTKLTRRKESFEKYHDFFAQEADFNVLFMGSSHMMNAVYPMELWNDYGIVSYNMGGHASTIGVSHWVMVNALDYTTPDVVVIDAMGISNTYKIHEVFEYMHHSFDSFPLSRNKLRAIYDLVDESEPGAGDAFSRRMELIWNFTTYHNRWNDLTQNDFRLDVTPEKGGQIRINVATPAETADIPRDQKYDGNAYGKQYLERIIRECQARDIEVVLVFIPFPSHEGRVMEANAIYDIAEEYGVEYINFLAEGTVNFNIDCFDAASHLNASGAHKITSYLGQFLRDRYGIPDQRENPEYAHWHQDFQEYCRYKLDLLREQTKGYRYLMMLHDDDYSYILKLDRWGKSKNQRFLDLLENIGIDLDMINEDACCVVANRAAGTMEYISLAELKAGPVETSMGILTMKIGETDYQVMLNDEVIFTADNNNSSNFDYHVGVFSHNGELLDSKEMHLN